MTNNGVGKGAQSGPPKHASVMQFLSWRRTKCKIHWQLSDGSSVVGTLNWFDPWNVNITSEELGEITIPKHALMWYREA